MRSTIDKISTTILRFIPLTLAFLTPLFFLPITADFFSFNKLYLVSVLASLSLLAWCVRSLTRGKLSITTSPSLIPLIILSVAAIVSSVWISQTKHVSLFGQTTLYVSLVIIYITATSSQKNHTLVNSVISGLIASVTTLSLITILHRFGLLSRVISSDILTNKAFNLTGGILPALSITIPVIIGVIGYLIVSRNLLVRSLLFASMVIMVVGSLINLTILFPSGAEKAFVLLPYRASWSIAIDTLKNWQTALLGFGPESYLSTFTRLKPGYLNLNNDLWTYRFPESGSFVLTLVTTIGLIGALSYVVSFLNPALYSLKHRATNSRNPGYVFLFLTLIATLFSFVLIPVGVVSIVLGFVLLIALTVEFKLLGLRIVRDFDLTISAKSEPENIYQDISENEKFPAHGVILPWVITFFSVVLIFVYWSYAGPTYAGSVYAKQANDLVKTNPVGAYLKAIDATKADPFKSNYPLSLSQFYKSIAINLLNKTDATDTEKQNATEYMQRAIDAGRQAAAIDPLNVDNHENLSNIYQSFVGAADGAANFAVAHLNQAIILDPANPRLRLQFGILFFNLGDAEQAIKLFSQAIELKQNWDVPYYSLSAVYKYKKDYVRALQYVKAGMTYTDPTSEDYQKVQEEVKALEALAPAGGTATPSATTK